MKTYRGGSSSRTPGGLLGQERLGRDNSKEMIKIEQSMNKRESFFKRLERFCTGSFLYNLLEDCTPSMNLICSVLDTSGAAQVSSGEKSEFMHLGAIGR